ncbi:MAG: NADH-quinone oxidoreductase subunit C [Planctomycetaceae bacterium]|nr:NADH-quinone oxidoreductase subunit C [Planctomycetaceae bacterium]
MNDSFLILHNGNMADIGLLPQWPLDEFTRRVLAQVQEGARIASFFGCPRPNGAVLLIMVLADDDRGVFKLASVEVKERFASLTPQVPQAHWFEREIAEQFHICPEGHPWLKPIRFQEENSRIGVTNFFRVEGSEIHEVAVGPVHAGIIEPGHFRFQCNGENVLHLEISLGYQHRGIEQAMAGSPLKRSLHYVQTAAGDTTIGHTLAYCQLLEALGRCHVPARAHVLRGIALELERLANHTGDLGALAGDIGYLPTASFCGRIRGDFLNLTAMLCGNRFGRNFVRPGGTMFDLDESMAPEFRARLDAAFKDVTNAADCLWQTPSVLSRFDGTGMLSKELCHQLGLVGPAARACGVDRDCRYDFAGGIFSFKQVPVATWDTCDVFGRAYVRWLEIQHSTALIRDLLEAIPAGSASAELAQPLANKIAVSVVEGWRGEICHTAITDAQGRIERCKIVDPSFHNWMGLAVAMRNQQISDFPLCNKSFNLSYCGHDL